MIPDNVEKIIMTKEDYDRQVEQMLLEKLEAEQRIEKAVELIKDNYLYYEDRLEDSIVKERYKKYIQILLNILNGRSDE